MRKPVAAFLALLLAVLAFSSVVAAQTPQSTNKPQPKRIRFYAGSALRPGDIYPGVPEMPNPPGPAPQRDFSGAWVGPQFVKADPMPPMTPAGEMRFKMNKPYGAWKVAPGEQLVSNDPFITCDPLGFPRDLLAHAVSFRGGMLFGSAPNRILIDYQQQQAWRQIWMDGRKLPAKVDVKGAPDSQYYGYSVGHWDGDSTLVIDTAGLDERAWLDEVGHPKSTSAHIEERYTRVDQYNLELVATLNDPKFYTKPWTFLRAHYYWMKDQEFPEALCIPSEAIEYRDMLARPSGIDADVGK
jgi:hypothetical protein